MNIKNTLVLFMILTLFACNSAKESSFSQEYIDIKQKKNSAIKSKLLSNCIIESNITSNNINAATIYFKEGENKLSSADKNILLQIAYTQKQCSAKLIIIGNISNQEFYNAEKYLGLDYERARNIYDFLKANKVNDMYLNILSCSNIRSLSYQNNPKAEKYNQRVELIFSSNNQEKIKLLCVPNDILK